MKCIIFFNYSDFPVNLIRITDGDGNPTDCTLDCNYSAPVPLNAQTNDINVIQNDPLRNRSFTLDFIPQLELPDSIERIHVLPNYTNPDHVGVPCIRDSTIKINNLINPDKSLVGIEMQSATLDIKEILKYLIDNKIIEIN